MILDPAGIRAIVSERTALARLEVADSRPRQPLLTRLLADLDRTEMRQATVLVGPRRVGKTWLMQHALDALADQGVQTWLCDFTDPRLRGLTMRGLLDALGVEATSSTPTRVFFDEVHFIDDWAREMAALVNEGRARMTIADSAAAITQQRIQEVGVGRMVRLRVAPLSFREWLELSGSATEAQDRVPTQWIQACDRYLEAGGFPEVAWLGAAETSHAHRLLREQVVLQAIDKDVSRIVGLRQPLPLERMTLALMAGSGRPQHWSEMQQTSGATKPTVKKWYAALHDAGLVWSMPRWRRDELSSDDRAAKVYAADTGLVAACTPQSRLRNNPELHQPLYETAVANSLRALVEGEEWRLSYWRDKGGATGEIDFVLQTPTGTVAIEVTASSGGKDKVKRLAALAERVAARRSVVVCDVATPYERDGVAIVPLWRFLLQPEDFLS